MKYELKSWEFIGSLTIKDASNSTQPISVFCGIVGDTYGFTKRDVVNIVISDIKPITDIKAYKAFIQIEAVAYVKKTYPDTP